MAKFSFMKTSTYQDCYQNIASTLQTPSLSAHTNFRNIAFDHFKEIGLASIASEKWKYTNFTQFLKQNFHLEPPFPLISSDIYQLVNQYTLDIGTNYLFPFHNNFYLSHLSDITDIPFTFSNLATLWDTLPKVLKSHYRQENLKNQSAFQLLNQFLCPDGTYIHIADDHDIKLPIVLLYLTDTRKTPPLLCNPKTHVYLGKNSKATLLEIHIAIGKQPFFNNAQTTINLDSNATLSHTFLQQAHTKGLQFINIQATQNANTSLQSQLFATGGHINQVDFNIDLQEPNAKCLIHALSNTKNSETHDIHLDLHHQAPQCHSQVYARGIAYNNSYCNLTGKIYVAQHAYQTNANLQHKGLLLSNQANINCRPQLEIYNSNVICAHGAAIGNLDKNVIFYMKSRGLSTKQATILLIQAFISPILKSIVSIPIQKHIENLFPMKEIEL